MKTKIQIPEKFQAGEIKRVAFFGSADIDQNHEICQQVTKAAAALAKQGKIIVNGGGPGVMEAATRGAELAGGESVAITFSPQDMPEFEGRSTNNSVDQEIKTANYMERMFGLIYYADLFICFKGGTGTLSEWSTAWLMAHLYYGNHKPIILFGEFWHEVMAVINKHFFIGQKENDIYRIVSDIDQLVKVVGQVEHEIRERSLPSQ